MTLISVAITWGVTLKQRIAVLEEQVAELHLAVYDQKDDFGVLRKATTSKLKRFAKALGDPSFYNVTFL
jgi:hypothetical protein